jgi:hypothetical protein
MPRANDPTTLATTLGGAILRARDLARETGRGCTVALRSDGEFCTIASHEYAVLRENSEGRDLEPLLSFLPHGGLDVHRASFEPLAAALLQHERF